MDSKVCFPLLLLAFSFNLTSEVFGLAAGMLIEEFELTVVWIKSLRISETLVKFMIFVQLAKLVIELA